MVQEPTRSTVSITAVDTTSAPQHPMQALVATIFATALAVGLGSCSDVAADEAAAVERPSASSSASTDPTTPSPSPTTATLTVDPSEGYVMEDADVGQDAIDMFGKDRVMQGYQQALTLAEQFTFREERLLDRDFTSADFAAEKVYMTPSLAPQWDELISAALEGDAESTSSVQLITYWNVGGDGYAFRDSGPKVADKRIHDMTLSADGSAGEEHLTATMTVDGSWRMTLNGDPVLVKQTKTVTYSYAPTDAPVDGKPWALDGWTGTFQTLDTAPDPAP